MQKRISRPVAYLLMILLCMSACGKKDITQTSAESPAHNAAALLHAEAADTGSGEDIGTSSSDNKSGEDVGTSASDDESGENTGTSASDDGSGADNAAPGSSEDRLHAEPLPGDEDFRVHGIYVTAAVAGIDRVNDLITLADETEINAFVIDIKNDFGEITYQMDTPTVQAAESVAIYIPDMEGLIAKCKEHNIYLIARIVSFKDSHLASVMPEYALHTTDGKVYRDNSGVAWLNPYEPGVWDYLMEIATEAARIGFDEVQFDYIRFSTDRRMGQVVFGDAAQNRTKIDIINDFTAYAYEKLSALPVAVSADVFGSIIDSSIDQAAVGQNYAAMAANLDVICPMLYPSHYGAGAYRIRIPDAQPYDTVFAALGASRTALGQYGGDTIYSLTKNGLPLHANVRPWLQAFTATWVNGHIEYGRNEVQAQIQAVYDSGYDEWILWNASSRYDRAWFVDEDQIPSE